MKQEEQIILEITNTVRITVYRMHVVALIIIADA